MVSSLEGGGLTVLALESAMEECVKSALPSDIQNMNGIEDGSSETYMSYVLYLLVSGDDELTHQ